MNGLEGGSEPKELIDGGQQSLSLKSMLHVDELEYRGLGVMDLVARHRVIVAAVFIVLALVSLFPVQEVAAAPETYSAVIQTLDEKKANAMELMAASTVASAGVSLLPDDTGTPVAEKLADLSSNFAIVLGMIYLEKHLLTIFGTAAFGLLIPAACALLALAAVLYRRSYSSAACARVAVKLVLLGVVLVATVPTSVSEEICNQVNRLIEQFAVMIVTSCVISTLVLLFFLWMANLLLGIDVSTPMDALRARGNRLATMPKMKKEPFQGYQSCEREVAVPASRPILEKRRNGRRNWYSCQPCRPFRLCV